MAKIMYASIVGLLLLIQSTLAQKTPHFTSSSSTSMDQSPRTTWRHLPSSAILSDSLSHPQTSRAEEPRWQELVPVVPLLWPGEGSRGQELENA